MAKKNKDTLNKDSLIKNSLRDSHAGPREPLCLNFLRAIQVQRQDNVTTGAVKNLRVRCPQDSSTLFCSSGVVAVDEFPIYDGWACVTRCLA